MGCVRLGEDSLCWFCARACVDQCSWAEKLIPVEGWVAERNEKYDSYCVKECPLYIADSKDSRCKDANDEGALLLLQRVMEVAREDYIMLPGLRDDIERWLRNKGAKLCGIEYPEGVIQRLRKDAETYAKQKATRIMIRGGVR